MGGSRDLNSLKSWNPKLSKNKAAVKKLEKDLVKREKDLQKEAKKREVEDLAYLKTNGLSWMYDTPNKEDHQVRTPKITPTKKITKELQRDKKPKYDYSKYDPMSKIKK